MYLFERSAWIAQRDPSTRAEIEAAIARAQKHEKHARNGEDVFTGIHTQASNNPCAEGSLYAFNDQYIELSAGAMQERRGLITLITFTLCFLCAGLWKLCIQMSSVWFTGVHFGVGRPASTADYIDPIIIGLIALLFCTCIYKYLWKLIRLENFVQRRLLIRFNRITRQVYIHRPRYAGGITTLPWDKISPEPAIGQPEWTGTGSQLLLGWERKATGLPHFHIVLVGRVATETREITDLWEYIRRYMEEGSAAVPRPEHFLSRIPWPWLSLHTSWNFMRPLWCSGRRSRVLLWTLLVAPALAVHATGHWLSFLLCWEPRWPRIIREAGQPGKPVPPLSGAADWPTLAPSSTGPLQSHSPPKKA